jgi:asparaginyl-tRNA synthetase
MQSTLISQVLAEAPAGAEVTLGGWVRTARHSKAGISFIMLNDGSCLSGIQVVAPQSLANYADEVSHLATGSSIIVRGKVAQSPAAGQRVEVAADEVRVVGPADDKYPIQPKRHTMEFLRTVAHLRARTNTFGAVMRIRNIVSAAIHDFFQRRGFVWVHTPIITASDCEGAGQMFRVSTLDAAAPPRTPDGKVDFSQDFFGRPTYLTVSGQLEGETYATALGRVYTFGPTFRAENSNTPRHLAEFWMVEPEMAFADLADDARLAEDFLRHIFHAVLDRGAADMEFFAKNVEPAAIETLKHVADSDFVRLSYTDAIGILEKADRQWEFPVRWGIDLQTEHERFLTEQTFRKPVILTDYPRDIKAFYMRQNDDGRTVAAMDVLVPRIGEIIGGSQREERLDKLLARMAEMNLREQDYWWYLDLRRWGSVPHAGFGLGLERTVQFITGMANIRDVIPYPRTPRSAEF